MQRASPVARGPDKEICYRIRDGYVLREIAGEYLAIPVSLPEAESRVAILSEGGKFIWEKLHEEKTIAELVADMTAEFDVSPETARQDIVEFLDNLKANQLLQEAEEMQ